LSGQALLVQGHDNIANANEITQQIATLKSRLAALDRERSEIAERLSALEHVRAVDAARQPRYSRA
jgi:outer membrane murein-binding lipoprotein Lpp